MIQVHANTYRNIVKKAGYGNGFGWQAKRDRYHSWAANFEFVSQVSDWRNRRNELNDGYVKFIGNSDKKREAEALFRLWLVENGYKYEFVMEGDKAVGIKVTFIPTAVERSA